MRIAGTACVVPSATVLVFANQVEPRERRAKFGNRTGSIRPLASRSEFSGSSSNVTRTTGVWGRSPAASAEPVAPSVSRETSEWNRNTARKRSGAGARTVSARRAAPAET